MSLKIPAWGVMAYYFFHECNRIINKDKNDNIDSILYLHDSWFLCYISKVVLLDNLINYTCDNWERV